MKNEKIISAWNKIEPGAASQQRMLSAVLSESEKNAPIKNPARRIAAAAACIALTALFAVLIPSFSGVQRQAVAGGELSFYKTEPAPAADILLPEGAVSRTLSASQAQRLFSDISFEGSGLFDEKTGDLLRVEGVCGEIKLIAAVNGMPLSDTLVAADLKSSPVNNIAVFAGYFVTDKNSRGDRNIIYTACFTLGEISFYLECGGDIKESDALRREISALAERLCFSGGCDFSAP